MRAVAGGIIELPQQRIILKVPEGVTHISTMTGLSLNVSSDGTVELSAEDAAPLVQQGWQQVDSALATVGVGALRCPGSEPNVTARREMDGAPDYAQTVFLNLPRSRAAVERL